MKNFKKRSLFMILKSIRKKKNLKIYIAQIYMGWGKEN